MKVDTNFFPKSSFSCFLLTNSRNLIAKPRIAVFEESSNCSLYSGKEENTNPPNYRTIATTFMLSKVMERVFNTQLLGYLEDYQLISDPTARVSS